MPRRLRWTSASIPEPSHNKIKIAALLLDISIRECTEKCIDAGLQVLLRGHNLPKMYEDHEAAMREHFRELQKLKDSKSPIEVKND